MASEPWRMGLARCYRAARCGSGSTHSVNDRFHGVRDSVRPLDRRLDRNGRIFIRRNHCLWTLSRLWQKRRCSPAWNARFQSRSAIICPLGRRLDRRLLALASGASRSRCLHSRAYPDARLKIFPGTVLRQRSDRICLCHPWSCGKGSTSGRSFYQRTDRSHLVARHQTVAQVLVDLGSLVISSDASHILRYKCTLRF